MCPIYLRKPGFLDSACETFTKNEETKQKIMETGDSRYGCQNELDKAYFQHDMGYEDYKDLPRGTAFGKVLRDKAFNVSKSPK